MILKMYCIYDRKSQIHMPPNYCHNTGHALRVFTDIFRKSDTILNRYSEDFQVFEVGTFDDQTAEIKAVKPYLICTGSDLLTSQATGTRDPLGDQLDGNQSSSD